MMDPPSSSASSSRHSRHHHHNLDLGADMHSSSSSASSPPSTPCRCFVELVNGTLLVTAIVLGVVKSSMCPVEMFIPKALIGVGLSGVLLGLVDKFQLCCESHTAARRILAPCLKFLLLTFGIICLVTLCVLTGRSAGSRGFCDRALYAYSVFIILFILAQLLLFLLYWAATTWMRNQREDRERNSSYRKRPTADLVL